MTVMLKTELLNFKIYSRTFQSTFKMGHTLTAVDTMVHSLIATVKVSFYTFTKSGIPKNLGLTMKSNSQLKTGRLCLRTNRRVTQWPNVKHAEMNTTLPPSTEVPTRTTLQSSAHTFSRCAGTTPIGESKRHKESAS